MKRTVKSVLTAVCALAMAMSMTGAAFAADAESDDVPVKDVVCYPTAVTRSEDGRELRKMYDLGPEDDPAAVAAKARALGRDGRVVRTDRREPPGLRFRETVRFEEGGEA